MRRFDLQRRPSKCRNNSHLRVDPDFLTMTVLDLILLAVMLVSAFLAMMRGFTREVLSIVAWASAAVSALLLFPRLQGWARAQIQPNIVADAALMGGTFLLVLIVVSFITMRLSDLILDSRIGAIDRTLGFLFGLGRGLLLVVIAFLFFTWLVEPKDEPGWVREARFKPLLQNTGEALIALLPEDPEAAILNLRRQGEGEAGGAADADSDSQGGTEAPGYRRTERQGLDQLLETERSPRR
jgi:membrane protein required for colicin V production